ncbi:MAG: hypothetical protein ACRYHA_34365 [Janthinobacterium lividum]
MRYTSPKPEDFQKLKETLNQTGNEMAELFGVSDTSRNDARNG